MAKVRFINDQNFGGRLALILCPGCNYHHPFKLDTPQENGAKWTFNEDVNKPTFSPSMLVNKHDPKSRCHSFVKDGKIEFLSDCFHDLKNKTVELPECEW
jgi:hypothetical protein